MAILLPFLLAAAWSAVHFVSWRSAAFEQARFNAPWRRVGLSAQPLTDGGLAVFQFPNQAPSEAALAMLADPKHAAQIVLLTLSQSGWSDAHLPVIAQLVNLNRLALSGTRITDAGLVHLYGLKKLKNVDLTGCAVTPEGVSQLQAALPECQIVSPPTAAPGN